MFFISDKVIQGYTSPNNMEIWTPKIQPKTNHHQQQKKKQNQIFLNKG